MYYMLICILQSQYNCMYTYLGRPLGTMEFVAQVSKDTDKHMETHSMLNSQKLILFWTAKNYLSLFWTSFKLDLFLSCFSFYLLHVLFLLIVSLKVPVQCLIHRECYQKTLEKCQRKTDRINVWVYGNTWKYIENPEYVYNIFKCLQKETVFGSNEPWESRSQVEEIITPHSKRATQAEFQANSSTCERERSKLR